MDIEIDLSMHIKDTADTVLAFSNAQSRAIVIPAHIKSAILRYLKERYRKPRNPELRVFIAAVYILIRDHLTQDLHITIDREWPGINNEAIIRGILLNYIRTTIPDFPKTQINFASVGKGSRAHQKAYAVHIGKAEADYQVTEEDLRELL